MIEKWFSLSQKVSFVKFWFPAAMPLKKVLLFSTWAHAILGLLVRLTDVVWQSVIQYFVSLFPFFFLHVDQRDQEWKHFQSVFNTNLIPLHLFIKMTPCGCHFKSSSNKNQSDLWQSHTHVTSFTNVLLQRNRLSLHHYSIRLSSKSALPWPVFDRMCRVDSFTWISQTSPPLSVHNTYYSLPYYSAFS